MSDTLRIFSFGGGVQSHAVMALQALGRLELPYDVYVFANVGADSENPDTLDYMERYTRPFAVANGIQLTEVQKTRFGEPDTLVSSIERDNRTVVIPVFMGKHNGPAQRNCTTDFKIRVVDKWCKQQKVERVVVGLGISLDEYQRVRDTNWSDMSGKAPLGFMRRRDYPLIDLRMTRADCLKVIAEAELPQPPKSSCFFCPYHKRSEWIEMKREQPDLFAKAVAIEERLNEKWQVITPNDEAAYVYLHGDKIPLAQVPDQLSLFTPEDDGCESGYCMT